MAGNLVSNNYIIPVQKLNFFPYVSWFDSKNEIEQIYCLFFFLYYIDIQRLYYIDHIFYIIYLYYIWASLEMIASRHFSSFALLFGSSITQSGALSGTHYVRFLVKLLQHFSSLLYRSSRALLAKRYGSKSCRLISKWRAGASRNGRDRLVQSVSALLTPPTGGIEAALF